MIFGNLFSFLFFFGLLACRWWFCLFVFTSVWDFQPDDAQVWSPLIVTRQNQQAAPVCSKVCWTCSGGLFCRCSIVQKECLSVPGIRRLFWVVFFLVGSTFSGYVRQETHQPTAKKIAFPDIGIQRSAFPERTSLFTSNSFWSYAPVNGGSQWRKLQSHKDSLWPICQQLPGKWIRTACPSELAKFSNTPKQFFSVFVAKAHSMSDARATGWRSPSWRQTTIGLYSTRLRLQLFVQ